MAYDSARAVVVLFGGSGSYHHYYDDTWEWDGANWTRIAVQAHPPGRSSHAMAYDSARGVVVLFGGYFHDEYHHDVYLDDTWEWDGTAWIERSPASRPPARSSHAMAYDSSRGVTVLFGGGNGDHYLGDTWEWDGTDWTQRSPAKAPTARNLHAMAYDSGRGVTVLFGGSFYDDKSLYLFDDTWEWDGTDWMQRSPAAVPSERRGHALAYDGARGVAVLFGGWDLSGSLDDTWEYDGTIWVQRIPIAHPSAFRHAMAYDSAHAVVILFCGDGTWQWDGTDWTERTPFRHPSPRRNHAMAYDSARGVVVLFGGLDEEGNSNDTWEYDGASWVQRTPAGAPPGRYYHAMAYDSSREVTVLYGGYSGGDYVDDTWEWDGTTWIERTPAHYPSARGYHAMAYDSARRVTVLFGGGDLEHDWAPYFDDTWEWDGTDWVERAPAHYPLARGQHAMAYDSARAVTVLFGGYWYGDEMDDWLGDTWEWDGATWIERSPADCPYDRAYHAMAYHAGRGKIVLFGGRWYYDVFGDTWEYDGTAWTEREPASDPDGRWRHAMAYDEARQEVVLFGGTWGYDYADFPADTWEWGTAPSPPVLWPIDNADGDGDYLVGWDAGLGATSYRLEEDDDSRFRSPTLRYTGPDTEYAVGGQPPGAWHYRVRAGDGIRDSLWSNSELVGVIPAAPLLWPIDNSDGDGAYLVDWTDAAGATSYRLEEDDNSGFTSPTTRYSGAGSEYPVSGRPWGTWSYRVLATNAGGDSPWSNTESALADQVPPDAPILDPIGNPDGDGDYQVDWSDVAGATCYELEEDDDPAFTSPTVRCAGDESRCPVSGRQGGVWHYRARAGNAFGDGPWSETQAVAVSWRQYLPFVSRAR